MLAVLWAAVCGDDPQPVPASVPATAVDRITAGRDYTCALREDGEAVCWGNLYINRTEA